MSPICVGYFNTPPDLSIYHNPTDLTPHNSALKIPPICVGHIIPPNSSILQNLIHWCGHHFPFLHTTTLDSPLTLTTLHIFIHDHFRFHSHFNCHFPFLTHYDHHFPFSHTATSDSAPTLTIKLATPLDHHFSFSLNSPSNSPPTLIATPCSSPTLITTVTCDAEVNLKFMTGTGGYFWAESETYQYLPYYLGSCQKFAL